MKKILISIFLLAIIGVGCNLETPVFPDFLYTSVYFPFQYPVRTLSLGEDEIDNSLDRDLKFNIGVAIGGLRENTKSWNVSFVQDPSLAENLRQSNGDTIKVLPAEYFSLENNSNFTIPAGEFNGLVQVQLNSSFLADSMAWGQGGLYVVPLRITESDADSILTGNPFVGNPDKRVSSDWDSRALPKDFTLFAVKYINEYHGMWLHRGIEYVSDASGSPVDTNVYRAEFVVQDQLWNLTTSGRNEIETSGLGILTTDGDDIYGLKLIVSDKDVRVEGVDGNLVNVTSGSGSFVQDGDEWGGKTRDAFYLTYTFTDENDMTHTVNDTLVFRDRNIVFETFTPEVVQ